MPTLENIATALDDATKAASKIPLPLAVLLAAPLIPVILVEFGGNLSGLTKSEAMFVITTIGATQGFLGNALASQMLNNVDHQLNIIEILPGIFFSVTFTLFAYATFLPGSTLGNRWSQAVRRAGLA